MRKHRKNFSNMVETTKAATTLIVAAFFVFVAVAV